MQDFSEWLQEELDKRGWEPVELARASGVSKAAISDALNQKRPTGVSVCRRIAKAFNYPEDVVMRAAGVMTGAHVEDSVSLKQLLEIARQLTDEERAELTYIALGKLDRRSTKPTS